MQTASGVQTFPAGNIDNPLGAEADSDPPNKALADYLNGDGARRDRLSPTGWRELVADENVAMFGWEDPSGQTVRSVIVEREPGPRWSARSAQYCDARYFRSGELFADLRLGAALPDVDGTSLRLKASLPVYACAVSKNPHIDVEETDSEIRVVVAVDEKIASDNDKTTCIKRFKPQLLEIDLAEPVGNRKVVDGSYLVPREIS
ncbi:MAG: hypothetical protein ACPGYP_06040 [Solirubrobacterales bacterium]